MAVVLLALLMVAACDEAPEGEAARSAALAPNTELPTAAGASLALTAFPGRLVVVDFWATWCTPCRLQSEILEAMHNELPADGIQFLAVNVGESRELVERFLEERPMDYPVLLDTEERLSAPLAIYALPTVLILDEDARIVYRQPGISSREILERALRKAGFGGA
jgi:thiol-disulfide isomerase/thioredoxin